MNTAILVIVLLTGGHGRHSSESEFKDLHVCLKALKEVKIVIPNGAENEASAVAYCKMKEKK